MSTRKASTNMTASPRKANRRRFGRAQADHYIDTYKQVAKLHEPTYCSQCGATYGDGRWRWMPHPENAKPSLCPACHRINDRYPAGIVTLTGVGALKDEMVRLARNQEEAEKAEHPLNRIMAIDDTIDDRLEISTTDIHLPRRIGDALRRSYHGKVTEDFDEGNYFVRVTWHKEL